MQFNQFNLYTMNANYSSFEKCDEVDKYIREIRDFKEYDDVKGYIEEHFGNIEGDKWFDYPELNKNIYIAADDKKVEVCALKNNQQYFGLGWKKIGN